MQQFVYAEELLRERSGEYSGDEIAEAAAQGVALANPESTVFVAMFGVGIRGKCPLAWENDGC